MLITNGKIVRAGIAGVLLLLLFSCSNNALHLNHEVYKVKPGEIIEIFTTTNSCCHYCDPDNSAFHSIRFEKREVVEEAPEDCNGCSFTEGWKFKALSPGTDTIVLRKVTGTGPCSASQSETERYIVKVSTAE